MALLFPLLWSRASQRFAAAGVAAGYFLAASRGLPQGVAAFFGTSVWAGILLWLAASIAFVGVHAALWNARPRLRAARYLAAAVLMAIPPFGIVGWAHPVTAAGVLFPGWGWWGLGATVVGLVAMTTRAWSVAAALMTGVWIWSAITWMSPSPPAGWRGIDTALSSTLGEGTALEQHRELLGKVIAAAFSGTEVVVLPESSLGPLTPTVSGYWADALAVRSVTVIAGAVVISPAGYDNAMAVLGPAGTSILYRSRMPVPVSMWQPWRVWFGDAGGASATFFAEPVVNVAGRRVAPLICYEQLLTWPVLHSILHRPDAIVGIANGWWAAGTSIPAIQHASLEAWARLFDLPLVTAFNQ